MPVGGDVTVTVNPLPIAQVTPRLPQPVVTYLHSSLAPLNTQYKFFAGWFLAPRPVAGAVLFHGPGWAGVEARCTPAEAEVGDAPWLPTDGQTPYLFVSAVPRQAFPPGPSTVRLRVELRDGEALLSNTFESPDDPDAGSLPFPALPAPGRAWTQLVLLLLAAGLCIGLMHAPAPGRRAARMTLTVLLGAALLPFTAGMLPLLPSGAFYPRSAALDTLRGLRADERIFAMDSGSMTAEIPVWYGIRDVRGYDALHPRRVAHMLRLATDMDPYLSSMETLPQRADVDLRLLGLMAVSRIVGWIDAPDELPVLHFDGEQFLPGWAPFNIVANPHFLSRARLVGSVTVEPDDERALDAILAEDFPLATTAVLAAGTAFEHTGEAPGTALIVKDRPEFVRVNVQPTGPCHLVLADTFFPGWAAYVDGRPREILRANVAFRAVALDAGDRVVEFQYEPFWYRVGAVASALSVLLLLGVALRASLRVARRAGTRSRAPPATTS
jgi:hypothetical protein